MAVDSLRARRSLPASLLDVNRRRRLWNRIADVEFSRAAIVILLLVLTGISAVLRIRQLHFHFWVDEGISVGIASHPLSQLPHLLREDGSPPLYYALLHFWMQIFGRSEVATHELSLVFALLTVPTAYWAGASLFGRRVGAIGAVLAAGMPFLTTYAQETRMYSLLALLSLIVSAAFVHVFIFRRRRYLPVFAVSLAASLYTHNWALFLGLASFLAFIVCWWRSPVDLRRGVLIDGALAFGGVAVLYLPWIPTLLYQAQHTGAPWALPPVLWSLTAGGYFLVGGRGAAIALLFGGVAGLVAIRNAPEERRNRLAIITLLLLGVGTVLIAWLYAKSTPAWANRYLAVAVGPLLLVFALGLSRGARLALAALLLVCCFWVLDPRTTQLDAKENAASATEAVSPHLGTDPLVLSTQPEQVPVLSYYLPKAKNFVTPLGRVPDPRVMDWRNALERFQRSTDRGTLVPALQSLRPGQRVALVVPVSFAKAPEWMTLIKRSSDSWTSYMGHDPHLKLIMKVANHAYSTGIPLRISVYTER